MSCLATAEAAGRPAFICSRQQQQLLGARHGLDVSWGQTLARSSGWRRARQRQGLIHAVAAPVGLPGPLYIDRRGSSGSDNVERSTRQLQGSFLQFPLREEAELRRTPPLVRVRLAVEYRVHSRQMLCVGGSQIPFGWSFLSIAKVPASWNPGDIWAVEVELPAGTKVEYKYVILEEQDWTQQVNELSEGKVEYTYRMEPDSSPPDVQKITKQMAIVAWQPGPNRLLQVPTEEELAQLKPGERIERVAPPPPPQMSSQRSYGQQAVGKLLGSPLEASSASSGGPSSGMGAGASQPRQEELSGMWEVLTLDEEGRPFLDRRDVWGREDQPQRSVRRPLFGR
ncbi:hypothetical protein ABPG77_005003 [Micractinium sp. CCAP 211/92]